MKLADNNLPRLTMCGALPSLGQPVHGGKVKLLHLRDRFGDSRTEANIVYMVSSARIMGAAEMVRALKRKGLKFVWNQNGVGFPAWAGDGYEAVNDPMRELFNLADFVVYQSEFCRASADKFLGAIHKPFSVLYNAVDIDKFKPLATSNQPARLKLLVAGTHNQEKRVRLPLEALGYLVRRGIDAELTIAGQLNWHERAKEEVEAMIADAKLGERVNLVGSFSQTEAPTLYQNAHILLHLKYNDPCPTVPIEALACGVPVVGSNSGGMPELVGGDGGILLPVPVNYDFAHYPASDKIAGAIEDLWRDWPRWSRQARDRAVNHFDKNVWLDKHADIFNQLLYARTNGTIQ